MAMRRSSWLLWPTPQAYGALQLIVFANPADRSRALIGCYGQHCRPAARSNWLSWPTLQVKEATGCAGVLLDKTENEEYLAADGVSITKTIGGSEVNAEWSVARSRICG